MLLSKPFDESIFGGDLDLLSALIEGMFTAAEGYSEFTVPPTL